jgi:hypothetical protein
MNNSDVYIDKPYPKKQTSKFKIFMPKYKSLVSLSQPRETYYFDTKKEAQDFLDSIIKRAQDELDDTSKPDQRLDWQNLFGSDVYFEECTLVLAHYKSFKIDQI